MEKQFRQNVDPHIENQNLQSVWNSIVCKKIHNTLISSTNSPPELARLLAISSPDASCWLKALPCSSLGLKLNANQIRFAVGMRIGCDLCKTHTCRCGV